MTAALAPLVSSARAILFDFDGPICSVFSGSPAHVIAGNLVTLLNNAGHPITDPVERDPLVVLQSAERTGPRALEEVEDALIAAELSAVRVASPTSGGAYALRSCTTTGRSAAVVTNNSQAAVWSYLTDHGLAEEVRTVVGRPYAQPHLMKPHPAMLERALDDLGVQPANAIFVGDSSNDVEAADAAGLACIGYANRPGKHESLAGADMIIGDMGLLGTALRAFRMSQSVRSE